MLGPAGPALAAEEGPYPVWWSGELELESLDRVDQRLRRDLWPGDPGGFPLFKGAPGNYETVAAHSCESLFRLTDEGYSAITTNDLHAQNLLLSECRAIALLGRAKPARVSHLRDFVMNAAALDHLPALLNLYPSCEFICYAVEANERGIPFTKFETPLVVDVESGDEITVWTTGWMAHLTVMARGDFTADGVDDMLLISSGGATEGSWKTARLYLMTRDAPGAVLRVIGAERELCPDYSCHPLPPDIAAYRDSSPPPSPADIGGFAGSSQLGQAEAESPPYPVWWSHGYELESLDQVEARLRRSFWSSMDLGIGLSKGSYDDYVEAEAKTCVELEALTRAGYGLVGGGLHYTQMHHLLRCRAIALLGTVQPAKESFLRGFVISQESSRDLLRAFGLVVGGGVPSQNGEMVLADGLGKLLAVDLVRAASGEVDVWTERGPVRVRIEARGDFTGDGREDLLVMVGAGKSRYRPDLTDFCLVTRASADAPLSMIDIAPYSCQRLGRYGRPADGDGS
jgi:hypothetical protein